MDENSISKYLINITDKKKYSNEEIYNNLKNCLDGKKACLFSCGPNLMEHKDRFHEIENDDNIIKCCFKNTVIKTDIFACGNYLKGLNIPDNIFSIYFALSFSDKIMKNETININDKTNLIIKSKRFNKEAYKKNSFWRWNDITTQFKDNEIIQEEYIDCTYNFIDFLLYIGIKEIYLFGFFHAEKLIDLSKYEYTELLRRQHHFSDTEKSIGNIENINALEPSDYNSIICSYYLTDILEKHNAKCFNVSALGIVSNKIKRITFDSIFTSNKEYIESKYKYIDFIDQLNNIVDFEYYYNKYIGKKYMDTDINKLKIFSDILLEGIYCKKHFNPTIKNENEIYINTFSVSVFCSVCFINNYPLVTTINRTQIHIFFCHFANKFIHKVADIYNKDVFNENYFNILLEKHNKQLEEFDIDETNIINKQHIHNFSSFKYFKLIYYLLNK